jgi:hypothetical protein
MLKTTEVTQPGQVARDRKGGSQQDRWVSMPSYLLHLCTTFRSIS